MPRSSLTRKPLWLIAGQHNGSMVVLTIPGDGEVLPVFGFEEEAELFLWLGVSGMDWRIREVAAWELVSILREPCAGVEKVALDPPPEITRRSYGRAREMEPGGLRANPRGRRRSRGDARFERRHPPASSSLSPD